MDFDEIDSVEGILNAIERRRKLADASVTPYQAASKPGDYYSYMTPYGFSIYGEILTEPEPRPPALQHYRFVRAYSVACPEGELGDMHVSTIDRILTSAEFLLAKSRMWSDDESTS